jgi:hypothetical protein
LTATAADGHNRRTVRLVQSLAAVMLAFALPFGQTVAPAHAHEDADHDVVQIHQHVATHHTASNHHELTTFDHADDSTVVWLVNVALHKPILDFSHVAVLASLVTRTGVALERDGSLPFDDAVPPHGPPGTIRSHRGPPFLLA